MKQNILTLITSSYGGGAERLVLDQMKLYDQSKFNLYVITFRPGQLEDGFKKTNATYHCLHTKSRLSLSTLIKLSKFIKNKNIKLIHAHLVEPEIYAVLLKILNPRVKLIITKHNTNDFRKKFGWRIIGKLISMFANRIICVSNEVKRFSLKYEKIKSNKILVYPNGINTKEIRKVEGVSKLRKELELNQKDFVLGIIGRLTKQKGHIILLKAIELLKDKIPNLKLLIIGDGELIKKLEQEVIKRGIGDKVKFLGFRNDIKELYSTIDIFCMPSLWEGLSIVLLEAMSTERLVIMSDLPNNQEVAKEEVEGIYFKKGDYSELADKILYYYQYPEKREKIKKRARKKIEEEFDFTTNLKRIEGAYLEVLN